MHQPARLIRLAVAASLVAGSVFLNGCDDPEPPPEPSPTVAPVVETSPITAGQLATLEHFRQGTQNLFTELETCSAELLAQGNEFLEQTDASGLEALKAHWQRCFDLYQTSTVLQAASAEQEALLAEAHSRLGNPLTMPGFIDSVQEYPYSGIVNDASLPLDAETLRQQHGITDETEVSTGFDVVAFLLWGESWSAARGNPDLPPRPLSDYQATDLWEDSTTDLPIEEHPNNRRRRLLALTLELLAADCQALAGSWQNGGMPASGEDFSAWQEQQLQALLTGLSQSPENPALRTQVILWLQNGLLPGVSLDGLSETTPAPELIERLSAIQASDLTLESIETRPTAPD
ncbi:imelysin family protein [Ketobacter sp.]|uniref:imelysin family protein n=1 Tax=Ketobacter sp. TaxID=2083498 RepID=UPI000F13BEFE|nr:imelysin family protein [Ketobacter sp.]RLU01306.1 MAG: hypothetical protein D9N14_02950 [Ketobacter sp.]